MADDIYAEQTEQIVTGAIDTGEEFRDALKVHWRGVPYGMQELTDVEHLVWFEGMMARDPDWARALMYVAGGKHELDRYLKTRARLAEKFSEVSDGQPT